MKPLDVLLILISILFATGVIVDHRWGRERSEHRASLAFQRRQLDAVVESLRGYHEKHGRYPTTDEGLEGLPGLREALLAKEFAAGREFLAALPGIRTIHGVPYLYENRAESPQGAFRSSPARLEQNDRRRYSRHVDKGVYVSSVGLMEDSGRVFVQAWLDALFLFGGGVLVFLAAGYVIARNRKSGDRVRGINAMVLVGVALLLALLIGVSSGGKLGKGAAAAERPLGQFDPAVAAQHLQILAEFRAGGALSGDAFEAAAREVHAEFAAAGLPLPEAAAPPAGGGAGG